MIPRPSLPVGLLVALGGGALGTGLARGTPAPDTVASAAAPALTARYPYDPACPWGRLSNGKGLIVRCITEAEAVALLAPPWAGSGAAEHPPPPPSEGVVPPAIASETPPLASSAVPTSSQPAARDEVRVSVGPVTADQGSLPLAEKRLALARARFAQCFEPGSLRAREGEVHVRFLVRPRGRAEGVSVARRVNVAPRAARCVADVVDRRFVGTPESPVVGATVIIKVERVVR